MKVKCKYNTGAGFSEYTLLHMGCSAYSRLPMNVGDVYLVYGQMIANGILKYLVQGAGENYPSWYPAEIFEVIDSQMHFESYFSYRKDEEISAVWGFRELVEDEYYLYDLIEREKYAIKIFLDRKKEIEEFLNVEFDKSLR